MKYYPVPLSITMASFSPLTLPILFFLIHIICSHAVVPANETFKYVNEGELGQYISEYFGDYRPLDPFTSPFQLCFYNQTPTAFTLALRMGLRRTESLMRWVWEANRGNPVDENATLTFGTDGNLVLARSNGQVAWQTATANKGVVGLKILPNGNMVLYDSKGNFLWQSFDSPTDTLLVGQSLKVGAVTKLLSRASADENVNGPYSLVMEPKGVHLYYKPANSPNPIRYNSIALFTKLNKGESLQNVTFEFENENDQGFAFLLNLKYGVSNSLGGNTILNRIKYNTTLSFLRLEIDGNLKIYTYNDKVDYGAWEVTFTLFLKAPPPLFQVTRAELASQSSECQLPKRCGNFGVCEESQCVGCPSSSGPVVAWSKNCEPPKLKSCAQKDFHYNKLQGVDHYMIKYTSGDGPVKDNDCGVKCSGDCKCLAYFYNQDTSRCWLAYDLGTLTRVINATHLAYIKPPISRSESDPSEHSVEARPAVEYVAGPSQSTRSPSGPLVVRRGFIPCPVPPRHISPTPLSQASVSGPWYQFSEAPVPYHQYQRMREDRDFFYGQVMEMRNIRSVEADVARDRDKSKKQVEDMRLRLRVMSTLVDAKMHGLLTSREGETTAGLREILNYAMREIGKVAGPATWDTTGNAP